MTKASKRELVLAIRLRYVRASKAEKGRILDEFVATTGYHRKYAIWLLRHGPPKKVGDRSMRLARDTVTGSDQPAEWRSRPPSSAGDRSLLRARSHAPA